MITVQVLWDMTPFPTINNRWHLAELVASIFRVKELKNLLTDMTSYSTWPNLHHHCSENLRLRTRWRSFTNYKAITQDMYLHHILLSEAIRQCTTFEHSDVATIHWLGIRGMWQLMSEVWCFISCLIVVPKEIVMVETFILLLLLLLLLL
jgi:hypothetical protein